MSHDTWIHRGARIIARPLAKTGVTPNQITTVRLLLGLGSIALFAVGTATTDAWGLALFVASMVCDRLDGEVARMTGTSSEWGHRYDLVTDMVCDAGLFIGIGIGQAHGPLGMPAVLLGVVAGVCVSLIFRRVMRFEDERGSGSAGFSARAGFDPDDAIVIAPIVVALGFGTALLVVAAVATPIAALVIHRVLGRREAEHDDARAAD